MNRWREDIMSREALKSLRKRLYEAHPYCAYCDRPIKYGKSSLDHLIPVSRGGTDDPGNIALACLHCNQAKADRSPIEWAATILNAVPIC